jgi:hypothetical protein
MQTHEQFVTRMTQRPRVTRTVFLMLAMLVCVGVASAAAGYAEQQGPCELLQAEGDGGA